MITSGRHLLGIGTDAARSALVVLRIHQPDLCACSVDRVYDWLLKSDEADMSV